MSCDYYVQGELVVEYIGKNGVISKTYTNRTIEHCWICKIPETDSDECDDETDKMKYKEELTRLIKENTYKEVIYESDKWVSLLYQKKYINDLSFLCKNLVKLVRVYRIYHAWESDSY